jgi:hypothetical protein
MTSQWEQFDIESKITAILRSYDYDEPHHFGQPFVTAYQIAIEFAERYPDAFDGLGLLLGGAGSGERYTLTTYLAKELSQRIKDRRLTHIEGAWLSAKRLRSLEFSSTHGPVVGSSSSPIDYSLFRLT